LYDKIIDKLNIHEIKYINMWKYNLDITKIFRDTIHTNDYDLEIYANIIGIKQNNAKL
jgi:hypothetical protein